MLTGYREIGITKALGFTPLQVVASLVVAMLIPALVGCLIGIPAGTALSRPLMSQAARSMDLPVQPAVSPLTRSWRWPGSSSAWWWRPHPRPESGTDERRGGDCRRRRAPFARAWWPSRRLQRLRLPRPLSLGAGDAFIRPLRGGLTVLAVLIGVTTIVFAFALREAFAEYPQAAARLNGDVSVSREPTVGDRRATAILSDRPETSRCSRPVTRRSLSRASPTPLTASPSATTRQPGLVGLPGSRPMAGRGPARCC